MEIQDSFHTQLEFYQPGSAFSPQLSGHIRMGFHSLMTSYWHLLDPLFAPDFSSVQKLAREFLLSKHANLECGDLRPDGHGKGSNSKTGNQSKVENTFPGPSWGNNWETHCVLFKKSQKRLCPNCLVLLKMYLILAFFHFIFSHVLCSFPLNCSQLNCLLAYPGLGLSFWRYLRLSHSGLDFCKLAVKTWTSVLLVRPLLV